MVPHQYDREQCNVVYNCRHLHLSTECHAVYNGHVRDQLRVHPVTSGLDALFAGRKDTLSVPEVADMLGMTKPGVYKWLHEGVIPGYKVGSTWFILRDELKETLRAGANLRRPPTERSEPSPPEDGGDSGGTDAAEDPA